MNLPEHMLHPLKPFADSFRKVAELGEAAWKGSNVAVVGLARNCANSLEANLARLQELCADVGSWRLHVETNDNEDQTEQVLAAFCHRHPECSYRSQALSRKHFTSEFAGPRTEALAEYRTDCQEWVRQNASNAKFVVVIDFDIRGGWSHVGLMHGIGSLVRNRLAYGMASVSLAEFEQRYIDHAGSVKASGEWIHYDAWALRLNSAFDDYSAGIGSWKHSWIPPVGSPPVRVCSAFGGMAVYSTTAYLAGRYDGSDCEHVPFHDSIAKKTGLSLYVDPSMRTVVQWLE